MRFTLQNIVDTLDFSEHQVVSEEAIILEVAIDSRKVVFAEGVLFVALKGVLHDGHDYIEKLINQGVKTFIITDREYLPTVKGVNYFLVSDGRKALQQLATHHREQFAHSEVIGITGSNGKTIVKEWLFQMLSPQQQVVKSPKSYNSQVGVPLSVLQMNASHDIGIFEAGISTTGEMEALAEIIQPTIGIFTNLGSAHNAGFLDWDQKITEKLKLFSRSKKLVFRNDDPFVVKHIHNQILAEKLVSWGNNPEADYKILQQEVDGKGMVVVLVHEGMQHRFTYPFTDLASFENLTFCVVTCLELGMRAAAIQEAIRNISTVSMRLEMKEGIQDSILVNDAYSADLNSLQVGLDFLQQQAPKRQKMLIISSLEQASESEEEVVAAILEYAKKYQLEAIHYISDTYQAQHPRFHTYHSKESFLQQTHLIDFKQKGILIKGARRYRLEQIVDVLAKKSHSATLQINLDALENNIRVYQRQLKDGVKIIAIIKAAAYGSGAVEIAKTLVDSGIRHLAVALTDEGVALRKAGITIPIIILNPEKYSLRDLFQYQLQPEVYSFELLEDIIGLTTLLKKPLPIHLKFDTGMHRLGFTADQLPKLTQLLQENEQIKVASCFSHLSASGDPSKDEYTLDQISAFDHIYTQISEALDYEPNQHILNSAGISRFPEHQKDYVRLGIGMYGIDENTDVQPLLKKVHQLTASLIQVKSLKSGDYVGYGLATQMQKDTIIGIANIGYADGVLRNLGQEKYAFQINGQAAPILGHVCMDLTILDLSQVRNPQVGQEVVVFGRKPSIEEMATIGDTIPYEILSRISERMNRLFIRD